MLKQTIKFALRSFRKSVLMNSINIIGLTLGLSVFFLISLFLYQETTYEKDFSNRDNIYQVNTHFYNMGKLAWTPNNLEHVLDQIPSVIKFTAFDNRENSKVYVENEEFEGVRVLFADSSFFQVFDYNLVSGNAATVLDKPDMAVIKEDVAVRMFGTTDVIGKTINLSKNKSVIINGVSSAPHFKTQLDFDLVVSKSYTSGINDSGWGSVGSYTYLQVNESSSIESLNEQLESISERYIYPLFKAKNAGMSSFEEWKNEDSYLGYFALPLSNLRASSDIKNLMMPQLNVSQFNTLLIISIAALLISVINFVNISTAKSSVRMGEVAVKRILGSSRVNLVSQFMLEASMLISLATLLALGIVETIVQLSPDYLTGIVGYSVTHSMEWIFGLIVFIVGLTVVSGLYPAIYLSSGKTLGFLRGGVSKNEFSVLNAAMFRKGATVIQFVLSISLVAAVITMFLQLDHLRDRDKGYESSSVFIINNTYKLGDSREAFKEALMQNASISSVTYADHFPNQTSIEVLPTMIKSIDGAEHPFTAYRADPAFFDVMGMAIVHGQRFPKYMGKPKAPSNELVTYPVVINETAVKALGLNTPIGSIIYDDRKVVGVVNDFVFSELRQNISPVIIGQRGSQSYYKMAVKMAPENFEVKHVEKVWNRFSDEKMNWYEFSSNYDKLLKAENDTFQAILTFSIFTIAISCLGLVGLAAFTIDQRIKEFGIRKVLGASITDIARLFSWGFIRLILLSFLIAIPVSIYGLNIWLNDFADRVPLSLSIFLITGGITLLIVFLTIGFQLFKTGRLNPVDTLRSE